jgi:tRNA (guanine37-N1)-methyltransferase
MKFNIFTLHPDIFNSFETNSLIARGIAKDIISIQKVNWRDKQGIGNYKQVDDTPYGGGSGMVLQAEQIYNSLHENNAVSPLYTTPTEPIEYQAIPPNNENFFEYCLHNPHHKKVTVSLTPRGFRYNQQIAEWIAGRFDEVNLVCGRYEGFDSRVDKCFDLELSLGDFVLNGGEVAAMSLIESISRLIPKFITKNTSVSHDSFSSSLNYYGEHHEYIIGKNNLHKQQGKEILKNNHSLFDNQKWIKNIAPKLEHPQFTRPEIWHNQKVPQVLLEGNHKLIQNYREKWLERNPLN